MSLISVDMDWVATLAGRQRADTTHSDTMCDLVRSRAKDMSQSSTRKVQAEGQPPPYLSFLVSDSSAVPGSSSSSGTGGNWDKLSLSALLLLSFLDFW